MSSQKIWKVVELINETTEFFKKHDIENPRLNIEYILEYVLNLKRIDLYLNFDRPLSSDELDRAREMVKKRINKIPLAYILGFAYFHSWKFKVTPDVLIPRPETELLVEKTISIAKKIDFPALNILDVGTGSGCIAISLAKLLDNVKITAIDKSQKALEIAKENARMLEVQNKIDFIQSDFLKDNLSKLPNTPFHIIVSNPPYIASSEIKTLQEEVQQEPITALEAGSDGLFFYKYFIDKTLSILYNKSTIVLEIGASQGEEIRNLFSKYTEIVSFNLFKDYQNLNRIVIVEIQK